MSKLYKKIATKFATKHGYDYIALLQHSLFGVLESLFREEEKFNLQKKVGSWRVVLAYGTFSVLWTIPNQLETEKKDSLRRLFFAPSLKTHIIYFILTLISSTKFQKQGKIHWNLGFGAWNFLKVAVNRNLS